MEGADGATHQGIGGDNLAYIQVYKGKVLENIHGATCELSSEHSSVTQCGVCLCFNIVTKVITTIDICSNQHPEFKIAC